MNPAVTAFFDEATNTASYVIADSSTGQCAIVDPVLDYDANAGVTSTGSAEKIVALVKSQDLNVQWILETHAHADHLTSAAWLKRVLGGQTAIGRHITQTQETFGELFNAGSGFARDGSQFDRLLEDGDTLQIGELVLTALHTPGHTPACMTYQVGDCAFVGDTLFMPDFGTARTDFPGGDAATLYRSIQRIFSLPPTTRLFMCHDYKTANRDTFQWETTVADEKASNIHVHEGVTQEQFVQFRTERDAGLAVPRLLLPAVQVNMAGGELPPAEDNGLHYLKIPVNAL